MEQTASSRLSDELKEQLIATGVWKPECPVALERLSSVQIEFMDFGLKIHKDGELIVFDAVAERVSKIFAKLLDLNFPIHSMRSIHHFGGDDEASMAANNSSCFNFRTVPAQQNISVHGYGLAIDVNPVQNPFITFENDNRTAAIHPPDGWEYMNRGNKKPGMVDALVQFFAENGFFVWGGTWTTPIDYHHFQPPRVVVSLLTSMDYADGIEFFELCIKNRDRILEKQSQIDVPALIALYEKGGRTMFDSFLSSLV